MRDAMEAARKIVAGWRTEWQYKDYYNEDRIMQGIAAALREREQEIVDAYSEDWQLRLQVALESRDRATEARVWRESVQDTREHFIRTMKDYLLFDNQRSVSWHEVQDCISAIRRAVVAESGR